MVWTIFCPENRDTIEVTGNDSVELPKGQLLLDVSRSKGQINLTQGIVELFYGHFYQMAIKW